MSLSTDEPMSVDEVNIDAMSLEDLVAHANMENELVERSIDSAGTLLAQALLHAINAGRALMAIQAGLDKRTNWKEWVHEHLTFSQVTACKYVRLAEYHEYLPTFDMSIRTALTHLDGLPRTGLKSGARSKFSDGVQIEACRLRKKGLTYQEISDLLGPAKSTIAKLVDPGYRKRAAQSDAARQRRIKAAVRNQKRLESVAAVGGSIKKAHTLVLSLSKELYAALGEATDRDMRNALRSAYSAATRCEAEILRALKLPTDA